ncbi:MAG TPA: alpha/beta hydrolase [Kofleriaceae bacterium]|jgi:acetyl esterase/lipase
MSSPQSEANRRHYQAGAAFGSTNPSPEQGIEYHDIHWTGLTAEPHGVDYIEIEAAGTRAMWVVPHGCAQDRVLMYSHGGGFVGGSISTHRKLAAHLAKATGCRALIYEYAYAHQHKFPHQLNTAFAVYRWLLEHVRPGHVALAGDSAGGTLTMGVLLEARNAKVPLPAAALCISGWFDMTVSAHSYETNAEKDPFFQRAVVDWLAMNICGEANRQNPLASPLHADLHGLPPLYLQAGSAETLVDETRMLADRAHRAGVEARVDVFPDMLHSFQMMAGRAPEADDAIAKLAQWVRPKLGLPAR